jgi:uncharacterized protein YjbJ (UPF0337 family)
MLNQEQFEGKWFEIKGGFRNLWGKITDDELEQFKGNLEEALGLVEERYEETKEEIKMKFERLMSSFDNDTDKNITPDEASYQRKPLDRNTYGTSLRDFDSDHNARH